MDIRAKKSLGQNFLTDPHYLRRIIEAAHVGPDDRVIEIGPGLGHLTRELAAAAGELLVIELDDRLVPQLQKEFGSREHIRIVHGDALEFDYGALAGRWKVVANLPYYISTAIIQRLLSLPDRFTSLTLMLQKEVAERITALPGGKEYGFLSVLVQYTAAARIEFIVPAGAFTPRPKVDSAIVTLTIRDRPEHAVQDRDSLLRLLKAAFSQRRKTLRNSLLPLGIGKEAIDSLTRDAGIDPMRRPETLSIAEFCRLADLLSSRSTGR